MRVSVIIPSLGGASPTLCDSLASLASQTHLPSQVIVSLDHPESPAPSVSGLLQRGVDARVMRGERSGPGGARNRALEAAEGDLALFLNDDVVPAGSCVAEHVRAHEREPAAALVVGSAPWEFGRPHGFVMDRLVAETSLVFFYDRMDAGDRARDWGYRHAWTLNLSAPLHGALRFDERLRLPMFDDLEWAFRRTRDGTPVRYAERAVVTHVHRPRYTPLACLRREAVLGHQSVVLREASPACHDAVFGAPAPAVETARARESFAGLVARAGLRDPSFDVQRLFASCRPWREAARAIGRAVGESGGTWGEAVEQARAEIASGLVGAGG